MQTRLASCLTGGTCRWTPEALRRPGNRGDAHRTRQHSPWDAGSLALRHLRAARGRGANRRRRPAGGVHWRGRPPPHVRLWPVPAAGLASGPRRVAGAAHRSRRWAANVVLDALVVDAPAAVSKWCRAGPTGIQARAGPWPRSEVRCRKPLRTYALSHKSLNVCAYDVGLLKPWFVSGVIDPCQPNVELDPK